MTIRQRKLKDGTVKFQAYIQPRDVNDINRKKRFSMYGKWCYSLVQARNDESRLNKNWQIKLKKDNEHLNANMLIHAAYELYYNQVRKVGSEALTISSWNATGKFLSIYFSKIKLRDLTENEVKTIALSYAKGKSHSKDSSISKHLIHLNALLKYCVKKNIIGINPIPDSYMGQWFGRGVRKKIIEINRNKAGIRILEPSEIAAIRNYLQDNLAENNPIKSVSKIGIMIDSFTGIRPQEIQALKPSDMIFSPDHTKVSFHISDSWNNKDKFLNHRTKTGTERNSLFLPEWATTKLIKFISNRNEYLTENGFNPENQPIILNLSNFQYTDRHMPLEQTTMNQALRKICCELSLSKKEISLYWLRHTISSQLAGMVNGKYEIAADLMGNSINTFLTRYVHAQKEEEELISLNVFS
ncbi:tyrosine-type recombinase/integrase [Oenococcus sp.]|uniref:tyrosine-type recombinase/integrase n=1 Tax=Oenococcus sp. TaxID=1979414 RepID=UPI0039ED2535